MATVTIAGFDVYPEKVDPRPIWVGGGIRTALDGTAYRRNTGGASRLSLSWSWMTTEEYQTLRAIWEACRLGTVTISCTDPVISGTFLAADDELQLEPIEGDGGFYSGSMIFREQ